MKNIIGCLFVFSSLLVAQLPDETNGRVPELDAFHKPIYTIWHEAWPAKDIAALKDLYLPVDSAYKKLSAAVLPGILRDKQQQWDAARTDLGTAVNEYKQSIIGSDTIRILRAAEAVHMLYEKMVRIVRPVTPQIDAFHRVLYTLHHYDIPQKNMEKIKSSINELESAIDSLDASKLPARWSKKNELYERRKKILSDGVREYVSAVRAGQPWMKLEKLESAIHGRYLMLEKVFE
ncbi:MAG: hypothetical protein ACOYNS_11930 [Bacteroidota bacterium]